MNSAYRAARSKLARYNPSTCHPSKNNQCSAAYFLSMNFRDRWAEWTDCIEPSFDRAARYAEFMPDAATIAQNVIVGRGDWEQQLAANKQAFLMRLCSGRRSRVYTVA